MRDREITIVYVSWKNLAIAGVFLTAVVIVKLLA